VHAGPPHHVNHALADASGLAAGWRGAGASAIAARHRCGGVRRRRNWRWRHHRCSEEVRFRHVQRSDGQACMAPGLAKGGERVELQRGLSERRRICVLQGLQPPLHCGYPIGSSPQRCRLQLAELVDLPHLGEEVGEEVGVVLDRRRLSARRRRLRPTLAGHDTQIEGSTLFGPLLVCYRRAGTGIFIREVTGDRRPRDRHQRAADSTSGLQTVQPHGVITKYVSVVHVVMGWSWVFLSQPSIPTSVCGPLSSTGGCATTNEATS